MIQQVMENNKDNSGTASLWPLHRIAGTDSSLRSRQMVKLSSGTNIRQTREDELSALKAGACLP